MVNSGFFAQFCARETAGTQHVGGGIGGFLGNYGFIVFTGRLAADVVDGFVWCQLLDCVCFARFPVGTTAQCHHRPSVVSRHRHSDGAFCRRHPSEHGFGRGLGDSADVVDAHAASTGRCQSNHCDGDGQFVDVFAVSRLAWGSDFGGGSLCGAQNEPPSLSQILVVNS